ncbi:Myosin phosphatase Rho-interacting protein [Liparis tanakae]|uniref:Myosin phosphatase Rho-interacting protein n=1 Tax=Liparis tanakae TaxID=230148 RepID=A0A4Z2GIZ6_9TELE|nr:Myosin phosphatase Rho-interacting protein [Liparis tanakae]
MSGEKATSPCNKFQANIFNKSKCQNCFKSRELHLLTDNGMEQAKPLYGGWLCLAPEGTDFDNPMQKSRKWQRRFFILYEDGSLSFALDELQKPNVPLRDNRLVDPLQTGNTSSHLSPAPLDLVTGGNQSDDQSQDKRLESPWR